MSTSKVIGPVIGLVSGLAVGLWTCQVSATEEVVVYGTIPAALTQQEQLRADMRESVRLLNERLKAALEDDLKELAAPKKQLASGETAPRG